MFKNVLVGVDGRAGSRDAIALARVLMDPAGTLTLVNVYAGELDPAHAITPGQLKEDHEASQALLERERAAANVDAQLLSVVSMNAGRGLHQQAEDQQADLIVVGSCSKGFLGRAMLGDHTRAALNGAPCAVAIAAVGFAQRTKPITDIGVGYNWSPESEDALAAAQDIAQSTGASVHAREVISLPSFALAGLMPPSVGGSIETMLNEATTRMEKLTGVDGTAAYGLTGEELAAFGDQVDILVVGSRSYGPVRRLVSGSTSDYLERHSRSSLLVLARRSGQD